MHSTLSSTYNYRLHHKETGAIWKLSTLFLQHIPFKTRDIVFFCIGTDRSTGDSLGPLTGSHLTETELFPFQVFGTLEKPLHALNLQQQIVETNLNNPSAFIVAIDACLGQGSSIGQLLFHNGPLQPGKAVGKDLPSIGDVSIKGIVNIAGFMEHAVLQSTRLHLPFEMSRVISRALKLAYGRHKVTLQSDNEDSYKVNNCDNYSYNTYTGDKIGNSYLGQANQI